MLNWRRGSECATGLQRKWRTKSEQFLVTYSGRQVQTELWQEGHEIRGGTQLVRTSASRHIGLSTGLLRIGGGAAAASTEQVNIGARLEERIGGSLNSIHARDRIEDIAAPFHVAVIHDLV